MSMDAVDDLEHAEGLMDPAQRATYCRPTCRADGEADCLSGDCCGCPCHHRQPVIPAWCPTALAAWIGDDPSLYPDPDTREGQALIRLWRLIMDGCDEEGVGPGSGADDADNAYQTLGRFGLIVA